MHQKFTAALYDLDGTIMNSGPGIMACAQKALTEFGFPEQTPEELARFVGPSLLISFTTFYHLDEETALEAVKAFRRVYTDEGVYNAHPYPGIREVLEKQQAAGIKLCVVTSKATPFVERVLTHFDLKKYFSVVASPDLNDLSGDKSILINRALQAGNIPAENAVMIGDTRFDIEGAKKAGIPSIGVTYGYGTSEEIAHAAPDYLANKPEELLAYFNLSNGSTNL